MIARNADGRSYRPPFHPPRAVRPEPSTASRGCRSPPTGTAARHRPT